MKILKAVKVWMQIRRSLKYKQKNFAARFIETNGNNRLRKPDLRNPNDIFEIRVFFYLEKLKRKKIQGNVGLNIRAPDKKKI